MLMLMMTKIFYLNYDIWKEKTPVAMIAKSPRFYNVLSLTKIFRNKVYCSVVRKSINILFITIIPHIFACVYVINTQYTILCSPIDPQQKKIFIIFTQLHSAVAFDVFYCVIMTLCPLLVYTVSPHYLPTKQRTSTFRSHKVELETIKATFSHLQSCDLKVPPTVGTNK